MRRPRVPSQDELDVEILVSLSATSWRWEYRVPILAKIGALMRMDSDVTSLLS